MNVLISATNAFCEWMKLDLPRIPSPDGKRIGTQSIVTDANTVSWQVHAVQRRDALKGSTRDVIAVEARSRYAIVFSNPVFETEQDFINELEQRWCLESVHMSVDSGAITEDLVEPMINRFHQIPMELIWVRNTDLSVNAHVSDTEQWLQSYYEKYGVNTLNQEQEFELGVHVNQFHKKVKVPNGYEKFYPMSRMLDDWLYRFANSLSQWDYPNTSEGDFPSPYLLQGVPKSKKMPVNIADLSENTLPDNVVSLEAARKKQKLK